MKGTPKVQINDNSCRTDLARPLKGRLFSTSGEDRMGKIPMQDKLVKPVPSNKSVEKNHWCQK